MKSRYNLPLIGRCESHSCGSVEYGQCNRPGTLHAVYGDYIDKNNAQEYYYCEEAVEIDMEAGFTVEEIQE